MNSVTYRYAFILWFLNDIVLGGGSVSVSTAHEHALSARAEVTPAGGGKVATGRVASVPLATLLVRIGLRTKNKHEYMSNYCSSRSDVKYASSV